MRRHARKCKEEKRIVDDKSRRRVVTRRTRPYKVYELRSGGRINDNVVSNSTQSATSYRAQTTSTTTFFKQTNDRKPASFTTILKLTTSTSSSFSSATNHYVFTASAIAPLPQVESCGEVSTKFIVDDTSQPSSFDSPSPHVISMESVSTNVENSDYSFLKSTLEIKPMTRPSEYEIQEFFSTAEKQLQKQFSDKYNFDVVKDVPLEGRYEWVQIKP
ncbi:hypothetical protein vseg_005194 [Gypsophila vaccaria]